MSQVWKVAMNRSELQKLLEQRRDRLADEHWEVRCKKFNVEEFDRETIAIESHKLGADSLLPMLLDSLEALEKARQDLIQEFEGKPRDAFWKVASALIKIKSEIDK